MTEAERFNMLSFDECGTLEFDVRPGASVYVRILRDAAAPDVLEECELRFVYVLEGRISLESLETKMGPGSIQGHRATTDSRFLQKVLCDRAVDEREAGDYSHFTVAFERGKLDVIAKTFHLDVVRSIR